MDGTAISESHWREPVAFLLPEAAQADDGAMIAADSRQPPPNHGNPRWHSGQVTRGH
jgi:hypothetical protein